MGSAYSSTGSMARCMASQSSMVTPPSLSMVMRRTCREPSLTNYTSQTESESVAATGSASARTVSGIFLPVAILAPFPRRRRFLRPAMSQTRGAGFLNLLLTYYHCKTVYHIFFSFARAKRKFFHKIRNFSFARPLRAFFHKSFTQPVYNAQNSCYNYIIV